MGQVIAEQRRLHPHPSSVGAARRLVRHTLTQAGRHDLAASAELAVSEVVTNALVHAGTPIDIAVTVTEDGLHVEVADGSRHVPWHRAYATMAGTGRGLLLLEETVDDWGVASRPDGKSVWFYLASKTGLDKHLATVPPTDLEPASRTGTIVVELLNVPLLLHMAWQDHARTLLREYMLATLDTHTDTDAIQVHAEASEALALLDEHIPPIDVGADPGQVLDVGSEPGASMARVELTIPVQSVAHFATLDASLDAAVALAEDGALMTPPTQPEIRQLRRWLCQQVAVQSLGNDPTPWSAEQEPPPQPRHTLIWDSDMVSKSTGAAIAADETNRIIAVNDAALDILGYTDAAQLVGQRLVTIIPTRYRQAHLAGFTLHLANGRSALLARTVTVPVERRDGTETPIELRVDAHRMPNGGSVFVAHFSPAKADL